MRATVYEDLTPDADDLLIFIDETGHETFAGSQGFYGLGGCVVGAAAYAYLKAKWGEVRQAINGDPNAPLHGSKITVDGKAEDFAALSTFFLDRAFLRIGVTTTKAVGLPLGMHPCVPVLGQLKEEVSVVAAMRPYKSVWMIFESSQRADPIIENCFPQLIPMNGFPPPPIVKRRMPKSSNEPGLEVADFIVGAAGSQVKRRLRQKGSFAPDFNDVFGRLPPEGCRYREVTHAAFHEGGLVSVSGMRLR